MADRAVDTLADLPFSNLCDVLRPLLIGTGKRGRNALAELMVLPFQGALHHLGTKRLKTPCGTLRIQSNQVNNQRQLHIALDITKTMGYVHGEVYNTQIRVPAAIGASAIGQPLSGLCETPDGFPGAKRTIENVRTFTRSTRIRIEREPATVCLDDIFKA
jgi:hypothetical protein